MRRPASRRARQSHGCLDFPKPVNPACGGIGQFTVRASADTEIVTEFPVVQIVSAALILAGVSRHLVAPITLSRQFRLGALEDSIDHLVVRQGGRRVVKNRVRFDGELVIRRCAGCSAMALTISASARSTVCPGKPNIRSRLKFSNPAALVGGGKRLAAGRVSAPVVVIDRRRSFAPRWTAG